MPNCKFCQKNSEEISLLTFDNETYICADCVDIFYKICNKNGLVHTAPKTEKMKPVSKGKSVKTGNKPTEIKDFLDQYVIGQEEAKKALSVAVYNHYKRVERQAESDIQLPKGNVLMIGPTGTGKTHLLRTVAKRLDVPFAIADATALTEAGYVGEDVESVLARLVESAKGDIKKAERGIVYIDEIDKLAAKGENRSITRDVSGEGVQQALLKMFEGTVMNVPYDGGRKNPMARMMSVNTENILFICGGAFVGLEEMIEEREHPKTLGFAAEEKETEVRETYANSVAVEDLVDYGLIPELVGRLPVIVTLNSLDEEALIDILTKPKDAYIRQYQEAFAVDNIKLEFTDDALTAIARKALKRKTGARGLQSILETVLRDIMFTAPSMNDVERVVITGSTVEQNTAPIVERKKAKKVS